MPRRSHKKSRQGCHECKRRHLKCDETRPVCINCKTAQLKCPYEKVTDTVERTKSAVVSAASSPGPALHNSNTPTLSAASRSPARTLATSGIIAHSDDGSDLNLLHLELLHWWSSGQYKSYIFSGDVPEIYASTCIHYGLKFPFLMRQILSTSALNLSIVRPEQREFYHRHASQLQSEAAAEFNSIILKLDETNILPAFLVSSLIGLHNFTDTFTFREDNFSRTLDGLLGCIHLMRGIKSIISGWWEVLLESDLKPMLTSATTKRRTGRSIAHRFDDLNKLVREADISTATRSMYEEAIKKLGDLMGAQMELNDVQISESSNMIFAWLVVVPQGYVDNLSARRPEALVILAYYAVVLHYRRSFWAVGDSGEYLINSISAHLGRHWDEYLAWPRSMLENDR